jgi:hypothetical protein
MILLDREDVERFGLWPRPFLVEWEMGSPEAIAADYAEVPADGPFLLVVHDEHAWAGQREGHLHPVAGKRYDPPNRRWWTYLADLYAKSMGISRQSLVLRFSAMTRRARRNPGEWLRWDDVYHWSEGGDLAWSALVHGRHPWLKVREYEGERQVRCE